MASDKRKENLGFGDRDPDKQSSADTTENSQRKEVWTDILTPPFTAAILGKSNSGKTSLSHRLLEVYSEEGYEPYIAGVSDQEMSHIPDEYNTIDICELYDEYDDYYDAIINGWPKNSVVVINNAHIDLKAGNNKEEIHQFYEYLARSARENSTILIFDIGTTNHITLSTTAEIDVFLCRYPRQNQELLEKGVATEVVSNARDELGKYAEGTYPEQSQKRDVKVKNLGDEVRRRVYISSPTFKGEYPLKVSLPEYWQDSLSRSYTPIDEENDKMVTPSEVLIALKDATANTDGEWVSKSDIVNELEQENGSFYPSVLSETLEDLHAEGLCKVVNNNSHIESRYLLTEDGRRKGMSSPGDAVTTGTPKHRSLLYTVTNRFDDAGFNADIEEQMNGEKAPDATALIEQDLQSSSLSEFKTKMRELKRRHPEIPSVTDGRDINIEVETDPGSPQVFANLQKAIRAGRKCAFCVTNHPKKGRKYHPQRLAKRLMNPSCKIKEHNGFARYYVSNQPLKSNGRVAVRPSDTAESTQWWRTPTGEFELRNAKTGDVICSFESVEHLSNFDDESVPAFLNKRKNHERVIVEECNDKKYNVIEEYADVNAATDTDWTIIRKPFVLEQYIRETESLDNWWNIIYVDPENEETLLEYVPEVTDDGQIIGHFEPLFQDTSQEYNIPPTILYDSIFSRNSATHWALYVLGTWETDETASNPATASQLRDYLTSNRCIAFDVKPHPNPFPAKGSLSTTLSKIPEQLVEKRVNKNGQPGIQNIYSLTDEGWKLLADAGIPSKLPDRKAFDDRRVQPVFDPRTKKQVEGVCSICSRPTGNLTTHIRGHIDSSIPRYKMPVSTNTLTHWTLYVLNLYCDMYDEPATAVDLYEFTNGHKAVGTEGSISTQLSSLYSDGLLTRTNIEGQRTYQYKLSNTGYEYLKAVGTPSQYPERDIEYDEDPKHPPDPKTLFGK